MAKLYTYTDGNLIQFLNNDLLIRLELEKYNISINQTEINEIDSFIQNMYSKYNFVRHDFFSNNCVSMIKKDLHHHESEEARFVIKGVGAFYFPVGDMDIQLYVEPTDFVIIPAYIKHYFNTVDDMLILRFFTTHDDYEAIYDICEYS